MMAKTIVRLESPYWKPPTWPRAPTKLLNLPRLILAKFSISAVAKQTIVTTLLIADSSNCSECLLLRCLDCFDWCCCCGCCCCCPGSTWLPSDDTRECKAGLVPLERQYDKDERFALKPPTSGECSGVSGAPSYEHQHQMILWLPFLVLTEATNGSQMSLEGVFELVAVG